MRFKLLSSGYLLFAVLLAAANYNLSFAQTEVSVYASGLVSPIGLAIDGQGSLWVAEEGSGNNDSRVSMVTADGQVTPFLTGLPSEIVEGDPFGAEHILFDENGKLLIAQGEGGDFLSESILTIDPADFAAENDSVRTASDLLSIHKIGPFSLSQGAPTTNPYAMTFGPGNDLYIVDAGLNGIVKLERCTGNLSVFATFEPIPNPTPDGPPMIDAVPTSIVHHGDKFYVGLFTGFPFLPDSSRIVQVDHNGNVSLVKKGLTSVVDLAIDPRDGNLVFLQYGRWEFPFAANSGGVFKLKNGGVQPIATGLNFPTGLCFDSAGELYVSAFVDGQILKISAPLSDAWRLQTTFAGSPALVSVKTVSNDVAWIAGFDGTVYRTTDGGKNWTAAAAIVPTSLSCIEALDDMTAFAGSGGQEWNGGNAKIYRTVNGGQSWEAVYTATGPSSFFNWIHFFDHQNGIAQSDPPIADGNFLIVKTSDGGATWTPIANLPDANTNEYGVFNGAYFYDDLNGWFTTGHPPFVPGGNAGRVFRTTDGGNTWTPFASGNGNNANAVSFVSPMAGIRTSDRAPFLARTDDGGLTWMPVNGLPVSGIREIIAATSVSTADGGQLWVYGRAAEPFILTSTNGGLTWIEQMIDGDIIYPIYDMSAVSYGTAGDSVQAFGITFDINSLASGGQVFNYRNGLPVMTSIHSPLEMPDAYSLRQNYPNPFNPETRIRYDLPQAGRVEIQVYNMLGQQMQTLVDATLPAGAHEVAWNGRDAAGNPAPSGTYLYRIRSAGLTAMKKMTLLR